jgi:CRISPR/Cas system-associated exonuclease Cas4 (RecB family)
MSDQQQCDLLSERLTNRLATITLCDAHALNTRLELGAMGHECDRKLWYDFRHVVSEDHTTKRDRQNMHTHIVRELVRDLLTNAGVRVGARADFESINGHFHGDSQYMVNLPLREGDEPELMPVFIHVSGTGAKFNEITGGGLERAKPTHYARMCVLLRQLDLIHGIYIAFNKNDESYYVEVVPVDVEVAKKVTHRAESIIYATIPPPRINESPAWHVCKACAANEICHPDPVANPKVLKNCRSCKNAYPMPGGRWQCDFYKQIIPVEFVDKGCETAYSQITI